jgi:hypothetical protein
MEHNAESFADLFGKPGPGKVLGSSHELDDLRCDLEGSMAAPPVVEKAFHALLLESLRHQVEGGSRIAMIPGRDDHGYAIHQVSAQHLVLNLDLVEGEEERVVSEEQGGLNGVGMRVEQTACRQSAASLFLGQAEALLEATRQGSSKAANCLFWGTAR